MSSKKSALPEKPAVIARLREFFQAQGMTQTAFCARLGRGPSFLNDVFGGRSAISRLAAERMAAEYGLSLDWLFLAKGKPSQAVNSTEQSAEAAGPYDASGPGAVINVLAPDDPRGWDPDTYVSIPYMSDPASAGTGRVMREKVLGHVLVHRRVVPDPRNVTCVRIAGHSMEPVLPDGTIVAIDRTRKVPVEVDGRIVCARTPADEVVIKRLRLDGNTIRLLSESPEQETYRPVVFDLFECMDFLIGQVIWAWQDLRFVR